MMWSNPSGGFDAKAPVSTGLHQIPTFMDHPRYSMPFKSPPTNKQKCIVFPYSPQGYSLIKFNKTLLKDRITRKDVIRVLDAVRPPQGPSKLPAACCLIWFMMLGLAFIFALLTHPHRSTEKVQVLLVVIGVGSCALFTLIFCIMSLRSEKTEKNVPEILEIFNQQEFRRKGVSWKIGEFGEKAFIQLDLDFVVSQLE